MWREVLPSPLAGALLVRYGRTTSGEPPDVSPEQARARWAQLRPDAAMPADAYCADVAIVDAPRAVTAGAVLSCLIKVRNCGSFRWPDRGRSPLVRLGCRWSVPGSGEVVLEDRQLFAGPLPPGALVYQPSEFEIPARPGAYRLAVDVVHEAVRWFGAEVSLDVRVLEPPPG